MTPFPFCVYNQNDEEKAINDSGSPGWNPDNDRSLIRMERIL